MKSPWKFLVGLTRRSDKQETIEPVADRNEKEPSGSAVVETNPVEPDPTRSSTDFETSIQGSAPGDAAQDVEDLSTLAEIAAAAAAGKTIEPVSAKNKLAKGNPRSSVHVAKQTGDKSAPVQAVRPIDTSRELDDEIQKLRLQLAQKLELQNAQLREMLARFEK